MSTINFGITKETRSEGNILFSAPKKLEKENIQFPTGYKFPVGRLVNVVANPTFETKDGNKSVLQFIFTGKDGEQHIHTEWEQDPTDDKFQNNLDAMNSRIKHILEQVRLSFPETGLGVKATSFSEFFKEVADYFNGITIKENEESKPTKVYSKVRVYLKLTYYKTNMNFPRFPNFIQTAEDKEGKALPCRLDIDIKYDQLEPSKSGGNAFENIGGGNSGGDLNDLPSFS